MESPLGIDLSRIQHLAIPVDDETFPEWYINVPQICKGLKKLSFVFPRDTRFLDFSTILSDGPEELKRNCWAAENAYSRVFEHYNGLLEYYPAHWWDGVDLKATERLPYGGYEGHLERKESTARLRPWSLAKSEHDRSHLTRRWIISMNPSGRETVDDSMLLAARYSP
jgi:hypothetical protein